MELSDWEIALLVALAFVAAVYVILRGFLKLANRNECREISQRPEFRDGYMQCKWMCESPASSPDEAAEVIKGQDLTKLHWYGFACCLADMHGEPRPEWKGK